MQKKRWRNLEKNNSNQTKNQLKKVKKTNKFKKIYRLKSSLRFQKVYKEGKSFVDSFAVFYIMHSHNEELKIGFAVGKKLGNAVVRNHTKRMMREVFRKKIKDLKPGYNIVWVARKRIINSDLKNYERVFNRLAKKAKLYL